MKGMCFDEFHKKTPCFGFCQFCQGIYTVLGTLQLQNALYKLIVSFVLHHSLIFGLFLRYAHQDLERLCNSEVRLCTWTYFDLNSRSVLLIYGQNCLQAQQRERERKRKLIPLQGGVVEDEYSKSI